MIEMREWSGRASQRRSSQPGSSNCSAAAVGCRDNWTPTARVCTGLSAFVNDARLHDALRSMYIPPSQLSIGSSIGRGLQNVLSVVSWQAP